jgi:hypothetical protein
MTWLIDRFYNRKQKKAWAIITPSWIDGSPSVFARFKTRAAAEHAFKAYRLSRTWESITWERASIIEMKK